MQKLSLAERRPAKDPRQDRSPLGLIIWNELDSAIDWAAGGRVIDQLQVVPLQSRERRCKDERTVHLAVTREGKGAVIAEDESGLSTRPQILSWGISHENYVEVDALCQAESSV